LLRVGSNHDAARSDESERQVAYRVDQRFYVAQRTYETGILLSVSAVRYSSRRYQTVSSGI